VVLFLDETGHTFRARLGTTWAPTGHPPALRRVSQRREVSTIAGLVAPLGGPGAPDARPRLYARHFRGSIHGEQVLVALRHFRRRVGRPLVVVWDRLSAHRAKPLLAFVAAHPADYRLEWLPPYAPDLNPEELCNGAVKRALYNAVPGSVDELHRLARRGFVRLGRQPVVLHHYFQHVGLSVNHIS
jgi:transposase